MPESTAPTILIAAMILNGVMPIPFGKLVKRASRHNGALTPALTELQIKPEEQVLQSKFRQVYSMCRAQTRRWI